MTSEDRFFSAVASRSLVRPAVRAIVRTNRGFLVQRPTDARDGHFAFIGGEYELGDSFHDRIRKEFEEETTARVVSANYRFVVENRFLWNGRLIQTLEHYFDVELDRDEIESRERDLEQVWVSHHDFAKADVRPAVVKDVLLSGAWLQVRHLTVELPRRAPQGRPVENRIDH
jgi:8-oxo-dGTP pyrophosphatase MutT (NUDIX family)